MSSTTWILVSLVPTVLRGNIERFLAHLILVEMTLVDGAFCEFGLDLAAVNVSGVFHGSIHFEAEMAAFNDWVEEFLEVIVRFEITSMTTNE
jgi:hypothetical protein